MELFPNYPPEHNSKTKIFVPGATDALTLWPSVIYPLKNRNPVIKEINHLNVALHLETEKLLRGTKERFNFNCSHTRNICANLIITLKKTVFATALHCISCPKEHLGVYSIKKKFYMKHRSITVSEGKKNPGPYGCPDVLTSVMSLHWADTWSLVLLGEQKQHKKKKLYILC